MKKILLVLLVAATFCLDTNNLHAQAYESGSKVLNIGLGVGGRYSLGIGVSGSFEVGIWETGDFGIIGLGAFTGFRYSSGTIIFDDVNYTELVFGPRGTYHFTIIPVENLDVYAAVQILFDIESTNYKSDLIEDFNTFYVRPSAVAGIRYYFSDGFAIFGELGYGLTYFTGGVSFKF